MPKAEIDVIPFETQKGKAPSEYTPLDEHGSFQQASVNEACKSCKGVLGAWYPFFQQWKWTWVTTLSSSLGGVPKLRAIQIWKPAFEPKFVRSLDGLCAFFFFSDDPVA